MSYVVTPHAHARAGGYVIGAGVHLFSLHFEHPDADCVPAVAGSVRVYSKKTCPTSLQDLVYSLLVFFCRLALAVPQSEIQDVLIR